MTGEQTLAVELIGLCAVATLREITTKDRFPPPRAYLGALFVYAGLSALGKVSPGAQRLANILGGVIILAYFLAWAGTATGAKEIEGTLELPDKIASGKGLPTKPTARNYGGLTLIRTLFSGIGKAIAGAIPNPTQWFTTALPNLLSPFGGPTSSTTSTSATVGPGATAGKLPVPATTAGSTVI